MIPFVVGAMLLQAVRATPVEAVPYGVGETLEYSARMLLVGSAHATMKVVGIDTERGVPSWHFTLSMNADALVFHTRLELSSWTGVNDFFSRRFTKVVDEKDASRNDDFRIFPDSGYYRNRADTAKSASPHDPIDDVAFMYYLRTAHFALNKTDSIPRYFRKNLNPVIIEVLGREMVDTGDGGRFYCWILHPIVDEPHGMFARDHDARIWISDDGRRIPVQIRSKYPVIGNLTLRLSKYTPGH